MKKILTNPWYFKRYIVQFVFIALVTTVTFLKRIGGGKVIRLRD